MSNKKMIPTVRFFRMVIPLLYLCLAGPSAFSSEMTGASGVQVDMRNMSPQATDEEIKDEEPDLYHRILTKEEQFERDQKDYEKQVEDADKEILTQQQAIANSITQESIVDAVSLLSGEEGRIGIQFGEQPEGFQKFLSDPKFAKTIELIDKYPSRYHEPDGSVSSETLQMVYGQSRQP